MTVFGHIIKRQIMYHHKVNAIFFALFLFFVTLTKVKWNIIKVATEIKNYFKDDMQWFFGC